MRLRRLWMVFLFSCTLGACGDSQSSGGTTARMGNLRSPAGEFGPLRPAEGLDPAKVALGRRLFFDTGLSADGTVSCATCHDLARGGDDGLRVGVGIGGRKGQRNTPTVFNAALFFRQFWDGRAKTLEDQIEGPLTATHEMGSSWNDVLHHVTKTYREDFDRLYPGGISSGAVANAIATFERSLVTLNSPFDRSLEGDEAAMSEAAREGFGLFKKYGCDSCHQGVAFGGNMFQTFVPYGEDALTWEPPSKDLGRYLMTKEPEDRNTFKVPSLRNVAVTAPYFHDGSAPSLEDAIRVMFRYQLGRDPDPDHVKKLRSFLESLTGEFEGRSLKAP